MKSILTIVIVMMFSTVLLNAQSFRGLDKSPLDIAYFPDNYAHDRKSGEKAVIKVTYSRPAKNGREVYGNLVPYGKVWRLGANENTEIRLYQDVMFGDKKLSAGTYSMFAIAGETDWTIIFSSDVDYWGAYSYKEANDVLRVTGKATEVNNEVENFTIQFEGKGKNGGVMRFAWDKGVVEVPFTF